MFICKNQINIHNSKNPQYSKKASIFLNLKKQEKTIKNIKHKNDFKNQNKPKPILQKL